MPELPEVEWLRRALERDLRGRLLLEVRVRAGRLRRPLPRRALGALRGRRLRGVERRGKHLLLRWEGGKTLLVHLGMTGALLVRPPGGVPERYEAAAFRFAGLELRYVDSRRFGWLAVVADGRLASHPALAHLGPDALGRRLTAPRFAALLAGRRRAVKSLLLDQRLLAGVGNIYADEALHRAGLDPRRPAGGLTPAEAARLRRALRAVLQASLRAGGTSFRDYRHLDGRPGGFRRRLRVYGRAGRPCRRCGGAVVRTVLAGRGTYWCPRCQG